MPASSITKHFIVEGKEQVEQFADAIEKSYQESLIRKPEPRLNITYLRTPEQLQKFLEKRKKS
jgi:hypothetical protein